MKIDHLAHSGFLVETEGALMLFDYFRGDLSLIADRPGDKPLYVFVSHAHADHFNPRIFSLADSGRKTHYLLSFDIEGSPAVPKGLDVRFLAAEGTYRIDGLGEVQTFASTDEGVAFLVTTPDAVIFHAGDLNWWDWPGEDPEWLAGQERVFRREIRKLARTPIDAAFVVLDDRLEENYAKGMELFLSVCKARYVLPMHFSKAANPVERFMEHYDGGAVILDTANETHWIIK